MPRSQLNSGGASSDERARIEAYRMRILRTNARASVLPFFLVTAGFAALFVSSDPSARTIAWVSALLGIAAARLILCTRPWPAGGCNEIRWSRSNTALLALCGALYGLTPYFLPAGADNLWMLALANLWLACLSFSVLLSQSILWSAGLAFALPALAPLVVLLLTSGEPAQTVMGAGTLLLGAYSYSIIKRTRGALIDQARHRVMFEQYDEQRQRSERLVRELTAEIERRKLAEIALRAARDRAEAMSNQDHLTSLANRRVFDRVLAREWLRSMRSAKPVSLVICDIDSFRAYNEIYGNSAGDQCLVMISGVISDAVKRAGDLAARYSGEQFYILLADTAEDRALDVAEFIRQGIHDLTILHPGAVFERVVTASFGVATIVPAKPHDQFKLITAADQALRRAKRGGGNCVFAVYGDIANDDR